MWWWLGGRLWRWWSNGSYEVVICDDADHDGVVVRADWLDERIVGVRGVAEATPDEYTVEFGGVMDADEVVDDEHDDVVEP